jgi:hypothetical protein
VVRFLLAAVRAQAGMRPALFPRRGALCSVRGMLCFRHGDILKGISLTARWNARCNVHGADQDQTAILQQCKKQVSSRTHMVQGRVTWVSEGLVDPGRLSRCSTDHPWGAPPRRAKASSLLQSSSAEKWEQFERQPRTANYGLGRVNLDATSDLALCHFGKPLRRIRRLQSRA